MHTEVRLLESNILIKCGVFWDQMASEEEASHLHLFTTTYGESVLSSGRAECWSVVLTMMRVLWRELRKVRVDSETMYGSGDNMVMEVQYLWNTLQSHRVMN